mgnify:FL=1|jgi:hypothetical protein
MRLSAFLLFAATLIASPVLAQTMSNDLTPPPRFLAKDLAASCESGEGSPLLAGCQRYLQGAVAMYELIVADGKELTWFCAPHEAPAGLLQQQYVEWARDNADQMELDAMQAVRMALADAFPCQE